jgi:hypothetical protein
VRMARTRWESFCERKALSLCLSRQTQRAQGISTMENPLSVFVCVHVRRKGQLQRRAGGQKFGACALCALSMRPPHRIVPT